MFNALWYSLRNIFPVVVQVSANIVQGFSRGKTACKACALLDTHGLLTGDSTITTRFTWNVRLAPVQHLAWQDARVDANTPRAAFGSILGQILFSLRAGTIKVIVEHFDIKLGDHVLDRPPCV